MIGFWWILAACAAYGVLHSILASRRVKRMAARMFGQSAYDRYYRLFFSMVGTITALPLFAMAALLPDQIIYTIPTPWRYLTLLVQAAAVLGLLYGVLQTGVMPFIGLAQVFQRSGSAETEKLVTDGLYRWVRHPLYTAAFIILWLVPIMTWNLLALNIGLSAYMIIGTIFEERKLVAHFGDAYVMYRKKTPRIVPGLKGFMPQKK